MTDCVIEIRRLNQCSFDQAVQIWNESFKGYAVDMTKSVDAYVARLHHEGLSPELSFIAFSAGKPAGFLLNGIRETAGKTVAWNGGTGVTPDCRGQGIAKALMSAAIKLYREEDVQLATLEAISDNASAIALYQGFGYQIIQRLLFLQHEGALALPASTGKQTYTLKHVQPLVVASLGFYDDSAPWQTQWQSVALKDGWGVIAYDEKDREVGYALYSKTFAEDGKLSSIILYQGRAAPNRDDAEKIVAALLDEVYSPRDVDCRRSTYNLSEKNELVHRQLTSVGFAPFIEQVHMAKTLIDRAD